MASLLIGLRGRREGLGRVNDESLIECWQSGYLWLLGNKWEEETVLTWDLFEKSALRVGRDPAADELDLGSRLSWLGI